MEENTKVIKKICMVSSAAFSAASYLYGWTAPIGTALGLVNDLVDEGKQDIQKEFEEAVAWALYQTRRTIHTESSKKILDELCEMEVESENLSEIIEKTEAYRSRYCTKKDTILIVNMFEEYLKKRIAQSQVLSNLFILTNSQASLEKIKQINDILYANEEKLDIISSEVSHIKKFLIDARTITVNFINSVTFILVAMAVFMGVGIFLYPDYDGNLIFIVPICYAISDFLTYFLPIEQYINKSVSKMKIKQNIWFRVSDEMHKVIAVYLVPLLITVSCFWAIMKSIDIIEVDRDLLRITIGVLGGKFVGIALNYKNKPAIFNTRDDVTWREGEL